MARFFMDEVDNEWCKKVSIQCPVGLSNVQQIIDLVKEHFPGTPLNRIQVDVDKDSVQIKDPVTKKLGEVIEDVKFLDFSHLKLCQDSDCKVCNRDRRK